MSFKLNVSPSRHRSLTAKLTPQQNLLSTIQQVLPEDLAAHTVHRVAHNTTLMIYTYTVGLVVATALS